MFENSNDNGFCRIIWSDAIFMESDACIIGSDACIFESDACSSCLTGPATVQVVSIISIKE